MNFLHQQGFHQSTKYCQILIFVFLNILNQILAIFRVFRHPLLTAIVFLDFFIWFLIRIFFLFFEREKVNLGNNLKKGYDNIEIPSNKYKMINDLSEKTILPLKDSIE